MLSICIGTYNRKEILLGNLHTLLTERRTDIEIVVVDNASNDGTWEALQTLQDERVRVYRNDVNKGASFNWIRALLLGRGKYRMLLNDRDSIDVKRLASFMNYLYSTPDLGDVIVVMNGYREIAKASERAYLYTKDSHPGNYVYSAAVIDNASKVLEMKKLDGEEAFDEREYNITFHFNSVLFQYDNWSGYPERLTVVMPLHIRKKIGQQRFDPIHGEPWYDPDVRLSFLEEQTKLCKQLGRFDMWEGFYRANILIVLEVCADEYKNKSWWYWIKIISGFAAKARKMLAKFEMWNMCKRCLFLETTKAYVFWGRRNAYRFYVGIMRAVGKDI